MQLAAVAFPGFFLPGELARERMSIPVLPAAFALPKKEDGFSKIEFF